MKVESKVIEIPIDAQWNEKVLALQAEGWTVLPGAKSILPLSRMVDDAGNVVAAPPRPDMLGAHVSVEMEDKLVFILRDGKLYDPDGTEVTEEERLRREDAAQKKRERYAAKKLAEVEAAEAAI